MRKSASALLLLFCVPCAAALNPAAVYEKLVKANGIKKLPLYVRSVGEGNCRFACTNGISITITDELLSVIDNEDELAGVLGHEMGHAIHHDEMKADILGLDYAEKAGYNRCVAAQLLKKWGADDDHPDGGTRYRNTHCP